MPSKSQIPGVALGLAVAALASWWVGALYSLNFNAENSFLVQMAQLQDRWAHKMDEQHGHKVAVVGGSSAMFSIVGEQLQAEYGLPAVNLGLNAGVGAQVMTERALALAHPGDTVVLAFEPGLLTGSLLPPALGIEFSYAMHRSQWVKAPKLEGKRVPVLSALLALRPGAYHLIMMLSKRVMGKPAYRYRVEDASPSGWCHTDRRQPLLDPLDHRVVLPEETRVFLRSFRDWCDKHQVKAVCSLPWRWTPTKELDACRRESAAFALQLIEYFPVLKDPLLGADPCLEHFSDTVWHLNEQSSAQRTRELGQQLKEWQVWSSDELRHLTGRFDAASLTGDQISRN